MNKILSSRWTKAAVFLLALAPMAMLVWWGYRLDLTANPLEFITRYTGDWTLRFLVITLCVTPLRVLLNRPAVTRFRRMLGLFTFFYASLHLLTWVWFDRQFEIAGMWEDVAERAYITVGMTGFVAMVPLAVTSTAGWVRRLGYRRWEKLHRLVYLAAVAGTIHFWWLVKSDIREPLLYAAIFGALFVFRIAMKLRRVIPQAMASR